MLDAMNAIESLEQLGAVQAVQHGSLAADNPKDSHIRRATDALMKAAFPTVDPPRRRTSSLLGPDGQPITDDVM